MDEGGADGFTLTATYTPGCFEEFVDLVVPELQPRGRHKSACSGSTAKIYCKAELLTDPLTASTGCHAVMERAKKVCLDHGLRNSKPQHLIFGTQRHLEPCGEISRL